MDRSCRCLCRRRKHEDRKRWFGAEDGAFCFKIETDALDRRKIAQRNVEIWHAGRDDLDGQVCDQIVGLQPKHVRDCGTVVVDRAPLWRTMLHPDHVATACGWFNADRYRPDIL